MPEPPVRQLPRTFCTQETFNIHPPKVLQYSPLLLKPPTVNKDVLRGLRSLPAGAAWGVSPWDLPPVEKGCQESLPSAELG